MPTKQYPLPHGPAYGTRSFFLTRVFLDRYLTTGDRRALVEMSDWVGAGEYCGHVQPEGEFAHLEGLWYGVPLAHEDQFSSIIDLGLTRAERERGD